MSRQHALFQQFPLNGKATLSTGQVPTPYHTKRQALLPARQLPNEYYHSSRERRGLLGR